MQLLKESGAKDKLYISYDHPMFYGVLLFDFVDEYRNSVLALWVFVLEFN